MSKPVSKTLIGVFVVGALALTIAAVMVFGSGKFLTKTIRAVMYFEGSVKGLSIGAPVVFRGVRVGSVTNVELIFDPKRLTFLIPVYIEIDPSKVKTTAKTKGNLEYLQPLVERGLRAQLQSQSFVTGQLMINIDFFPETLPGLVGLDPRYAEIPTIPSTLEQLSKDIQDLPWKDLFENAHAAVKGIDKLVNSPAMASTIKNMDQALAQATQVLKTVNEQMKPILVNVEESTALIRSSAVKVDAALSGEKGVPAQLEETFKAVQKALAQADTTMQTVEGLATQNSWIVTQAGETMEELGKAADALRTLSDFLERHPEALLKGKKAP
jgi:paraquat-inducible protein B